MRPGRLKVGAAELLGADGIFINLTFPHMPAVKEVADVRVLPCQPGVDLGVSVCHKDSHYEGVSLKNGQGPFKAFQLHVVAATCFIGLK